MFSCRLLFGPTVVPPWYHRGTTVVRVYLFVTFLCVRLFLSFPPSVVRLLLFLLLVFLSTSRLFFHFPDIFQSRFWDFDQDALPDGPIQGLAERLKTTILSSKATSTSLLYHRAFRKWKEFTISTFQLTGMSSPPNPFMLPCTCITLLLNPIPLV